MENIKVYAISNIGNIRDNHEDNFFVPKDGYIHFDRQKEIKSKDMNIEYEYDGDDGVFAVCDGMGGHNAGEVASRLAVEYINEKYNNILTDDKNELVNFIKELNNYVCDYSEKNIECSNMGTTFSALVIKNDKIHILHVGDSRIYMCVNNELKQISKDHTEGCRLLEAGIIKKEDLLKFPNRKSLYKYIGRNGELIADCELIDCTENVRFIISSDGLSDTLEHMEMQKIINENEIPKDVCHNLVKKCLEKGNKCSDNVTIICIDIKIK